MTKAAVYRVALLSEAGLRKGDGSAWDEIEKSVQ